MMMRRRALVTALALVLVVATGIAAEQAEHTGTYGPLSLYTEAVSIVHAQYVDPISWDRLAQLGIRGMVDVLDGDSEVLTPEQYRDATAAAGPGETQVGLALTRRDHRLAVITAMDGTPAAAGVQPGDEILKIDGVDAIGMQPIEAAGRLRGRPGTTVVLSIARKGWAEPRSITLTRAAAPRAVSAREVAPHVLYVRLRALEDATPAELDRVLTESHARDATGLILDLRNDAGKSARAAVAIAGMFVKRETPVALLDSRPHGDVRELHTSTEPAYGRVPISVLVNRGTASAAEVLAGALRDSGRAVVVGNKTFGDASAQSLVPLSDGSALSLTTARYLTPKHQLIDGKGVAPDFAVDMPEGAPPATAAASAPDLAGDPQLALATDIVKAASIEAGRGYVEPAGTADTGSQTAGRRAPGG
jgi:carboxyl-terminal processing protease